MTQEAMKLALEALEESLGYVEEEAENAQRLYGQYPTRQARIQGLKDDVRKHMKAITALQEALAEQPAQQEPVAKICHDLDGHIGWNPNLRQLPDEGVALYTSPPAQRTWVGLTDEEIQKEFHPLHATGLQFARAIEAKLKEKNNG